MACTICGNPEAKSPGRNCCPRPRYVDVDTFRRTWVRHFGKPTNPGDERFLISGIEGFRDDYLSGSPMSLPEYFARVEA